MSRISAKPIDAEAIAEMADRGEDISTFFTRDYQAVRPPVQRVSIDLSASLLAALDEEAESLQVSRQAVIKTMLQDGLDRRSLAKQARQAA